MPVPILQFILLFLLGIVVAADMEKGEVEVTSSAETLGVDTGKTGASQQQQLHAIHPERTHRDGYVIEAIYYHNSTCFT